MTLNPSLASGSSKLACFRYSVTTREPGASDVLTYGLTLSPFSMAFLASNPAATSTDGLLVFVQDVIAAMTTAPCFIFIEPPLVPYVASEVNASGFNSKPRSFTGAVNALLNVSLSSAIGTRSCGRLGPANEGTTAPRSSSSVSVYSGCGVSASWKSPCARA